MNTDILTRMDIVVEDCGSSNPFDIIEYLGAIHVPLYSSVIGYVKRLRGFNWVGINATLPENQKILTGMHECAHLVGHLDANGFGSHQETSLFTTKQGLYDKSLCIQEKEANLVGAEFTIQTKPFLDLIGYGSQAVTELVATQNKLDEAVHDYEQMRSSYSHMTISDFQRKRLNAYAKKIQQLKGIVQEMQGDIASAGYCRSIPEIAQELNFDEDFIVYKAEALRIRGYELPPFELQRYDKMMRW